MHKLQENHKTLKKYFFIIFIMTDRKTDKTSYISDAHGFNNKRKNYNGIVPFVATLLKGDSLYFSQ